MTWASPGSTVTYRATISNPTERAIIIPLRVDGIPSGWGAAIINEEKDQIDSVYVDAKRTKSMVGIKLKPPFKPVF